MHQWFRFEIPSFREGNLGKKPIKNHGCCKLHEMDSGPEMKKLSR